MFEMGRLLATPDVLYRVPKHEIMSALDRHLACDWGEMCEEDRETNDYALKHGGRLFSAYVSRDGVKFWIITEADRSATTILLPENY